MNFIFTSVITFELLNILLSVYDMNIYFLQYDIVHAMYKYGRFFEGADNWR